jgi:anti-sigma B factor antagonist
MSKQSDSDKSTLSVPDQTTNSGEVDQGGAMDLRMRVRENEGITIVDVAGELELHNAPQLRAELLKLCEADAPCVAVDLSGLTFIDSTGIGVLVGALKRAREHGGALTLICPVPRIRRVFEITGLLKALPLYETRGEALAVCAPQSAPVASLDTPAVATPAAAKPKSANSIEAAGA